MRAKMAVTYRRALGQADALTASVEQVDQPLAYGRLKNGLTR
jgi:hypothetical protein